MADEAQLPAGFGGHLGLTLEAVSGDVVRGTIGDTPERSSELRHRA
jgi:hypothetical protein